MNLYITRHLLWNGQSSSLSKGLPLEPRYLHSQKGVPEIDMVQEQLHSSRYVIIYPGVLFQISVKDLFFFAKHCTF